MGLTEVWYLPLAQHSLECPPRNPVLSLAVLVEQTRGGALDIHQADTGAVAQHELDQWCSSLAAEVGGIPHERFSAPEMGPSLFKGGLSDPALIIVVRQAQP